MGPCYESIPFPDTILQGQRIFSEYKEEGTTCLALFASLFRDSILPSIPSTILQVNGQIAKLQIIVYAKVSHSMYFDLF